MFFNEQQPIQHTISSLGHLKRTTYSRFFCEIRNHDDDVDVLFPDQPPERLEGGLQRTLGADVSVVLPEAVDEVGVDVVGALLLA